MIRPPGSGSRQGCRDPVHELTAIAGICSRLGHLPLAIELGGARIRLLSPARIFDRLEHSLALLTGRARDLPHRHQTLRAAIDWSHDLLDPAEQRLFRRPAIVGE